MNGGNYTSDELKKQKTLTEQRYQTESAYQTNSASATTCPHCGAAVPEGCDFCVTGISKMTCAHSAEPT